MIAPNNDGSPQRGSAGQVRATHQNLPGITNGEDIGQLMIAPNNDGSPQRGSAGQVRATHQNLPGITNGENIGQLMIAPNNDGSPQRGSSGQVRATHQNRSGITNSEDISQQINLSSDNGSPQPAKGPNPGSIGAIISQYKSRVTKMIWRDPKWKKQEIWQRNYYEHIIRDQEEYNELLQYILDNPLNWPKDA